MLGIAALAQLALAEFPQTGGGGGGPPWRRWLAQLYPGETLNRVPDGELVRNIVHHMLMEGEALYRQGQIAPLSIDLTSGTEGLTVSAEAEEQEISVTVPLEALARGDKAPEIDPSIFAVIPMGEGYRIIFRAPYVDDSILVRVPPQFKEDSEDDLIAILMASYD